jgi:hypothetical protein
MDKNNYMKSIGNAIKTGLTVLYAITSLPMSGLAQDIPDYSKQNDNKKQTLGSVLECNLIFSKSDLQYLATADRYAEIWKKKVEKTGNKELIEKYNSHLSVLNNFKENINFRPEIWMEAYDGNIEELIINSCEDFAHFNLKNGNSYITDFKRDIELNTKLKRDAIKGSKDFYDMFFDPLNEYKQEINSSEGITLDSVLKDMKNQ